MLAAAVALAAAGGATASTGGSLPALAPSVSGVHCWRACADLDAATAGSVVRVSGRRLRGARSVVFLGARGRGDDVAVRIRAASSRGLYVTVPRRARSGPVGVVDSQGAASRPSGGVLSIAPRSQRRRAARVSGRGVDAQLQSRRLYIGGRARTRLRFLLTGSSAQPVRVDVVRLTDGAVVARWLPGVLPAGAPQAIDWNGLSNGRPLPTGRYQFRLYVGPDATAPATLGGGATASQGASPNAAASLTLVSDIFPIRGPHEYGGANARFGAPRSGHTHQGQDVFAPCGTPLVAAHGGVVKLRAFQSAAGNYVVIHGAGTDLDYVYMHMARRALVARGQHVYTGQPIGFIGETGDAHGCHLHFELWHAPGWYSGGAPFDPLPSLKAWDRLS